MYFQDISLLYSLTNSKTMVNYCNKLSPSGGYNFLSNWLSKLADKPISFPSGLARAVFDNNQKVGRTYVITGDKKVPASTMTSHLWLILDEKSKHQENEILMPKNWMWNKSDESFSALLESICEVDKSFRESRDTFLKQCIEIVKFQYQNNKIHCVDNILFNIETVPTEKLCMDCGCEYDPTFKTCRNCGNNKFTKETVETSTFEAGKVNVELHPYSSFTD